MKTPIEELIEDLRNQTDVVLKMNIPTADKMARIGQIDVAIVQATMKLPKEKEYYALAKTKWNKSA